MAPLARAVIVRSLLVVYFSLATTAKGECLNDHVQCISWATDKQCEVNPLYMLYHCRRSCNVCTAGCVDKDTNCIYWVNSCRNHKYMVTHCMKTCGICTCCPAAATTIATTNTNSTTNYFAVTTMSSSGPARASVSSLTSQKTLTGVTATSSKAFTGITKTDPTRKTDPIVTTEFPLRTTTAENITVLQRRTKKTNDSMMILAVTVPVSIATLLCLISLLWFWNRTRKRSSRNQSRGNSPTTDPAAHVNLGLSERQTEILKENQDPADGSRSNIEHGDNSTSYPIYDYSSVPESVIGQIRPQRAGPASVSPRMQHGKNICSERNIYEEPKDQLGFNFMKCSGAQEQNEGNSTNPQEAGPPIYWVLEGPDSYPPDTATNESTNDYQCLKKQSSSQYQTLRKS